MLHRLRAWGAFGWGGSGGQDLALNRYGCARRRGLGIRTRSRRTFSSIGTGRTLRLAAEIQAAPICGRQRLRRDIEFDTRVQSAVFDPQAKEWTLRTDRGDVAQAPHCIMAVGCLSLPRLPEFPGRHKAAFNAVALF
jgi:hypothetical protein